MALNAKVKEYMDQNALKIAATAPLKQAMAAMMEGNTDFLVVTSGNDIVGIVTEGDVLKCISSGGDPLKREVGFCMTPCRVTGVGDICLQIGEDHTLQDALDVMSAGGIAHLLVVGKSGKVNGTLSVRDIFSFFLGKKRA